jgi:hypothetical protein
MRCVGLVNETASIAGPSVTHAGHFVHVSFKTLIWLRLRVGSNLVFQFKASVGKLSNVPLCRLLSILIVVHVHKMELNALSLWFFVPCKGRIELLSYR